MTLLVILLLILIAIYIIKQKNTVYEGYWDLVPYEYKHEIARCFDLDCVQRKACVCTNWCDTNMGPLKAEHCKKNCQYAAYLYIDELARNDKIFGRFMLPHTNMDVALDKIRGSALFN